MPAMIVSPVPRVEDNYLLNCHEPYSVASRSSQIRMQYARNAEGSGRNLTAQRVTRPRSCEAETQVWTARCSVTRHSAPKRRTSQTSFDGVTRHAGQFGVELDHVFWRHVRPVGLPLGMGNPILLPSTLSQLFKNNILLVQYFNMNTLLRT
jgi:hypothetical protein